MNTTMDDRLWTKRFGIFMTTFLLAAILLAGMVRGAWAAEIKNWLADERYNEKVEQLSDNCIRVVVSDNCAWITEDWCANGYSITKLIDIAIGIRYPHWKLIYQQVTHPWKYVTKASLLFVKAGPNDWKPEKGDAK